jgi:hypothetical protein
MKVFYIYSSEIGPNHTTHPPKWRCVEYDGCEPVWENIRHKLELKHLKTPKRYLWCYFVGVAYSLWPQRDVTMKGHEKLQDGDKLILIRRPFPSALSRDENHGGHVSREGVYVPPNSRFQVSNDMTEDEKIQASMSQGLNMFKKIDDLNHPAEYEYNGVTPIPPSHYKCLGCNVEGDHFRMDCSSGNIGGEDSGKKSLDRVQRPHGIPKSQLKRVDENKRGNAMKDDDGNYVVRVQPKFSKSRLGEDPEKTEEIEVPGNTQIEETLPKEIPVNWIIAEHFCVSRRKKKRKPFFREEDEDLFYFDNLVGEFDFEASMEKQDQHSKHVEEEYYRNNPSKRFKHNTVCTHWLRGTCVNSQMECNFQHTCDPSIMPECKFFKEGTCSNEDLCMFRHGRHTTQPKLCPQYVGGFCPMGPKCSLEHVKREIPLEEDFVGR